MSKLSYRLAGIAVTEHAFEVPLDHGEPDKERISVAAFELVDPAKAGDDLPWLLFLQGGPGMPAPRPLSAGGGWLSRALQTHRVLLVDQRGTGRSARLSTRDAARFASPQALAARIALMRADSVVADVESIRQRLCGDRPWEVLAQSYGGRVTLTYLCRAPHGLRACYVAGGLPSIDAGAYDVYLRTIPRVREKVLSYYERFPRDLETVHRIAEALSSKEALLPDGGRLSVSRMRQIGVLLGFGDGASRLHWLLADAVDRDGLLSEGFLEAVSDLTSYARSPLYPLLQDVCKAQGDGATAWAALRAMGQFPEFDEASDPLLLTGEYTFPWMFEETAALRPFAEAAQLLAERPSWPRLWSRDLLAANEVPVAAVIYRDDMFIDAGHSLATASEVPHVRHWLTDEWQHDGLNASGGSVLDRLLRTVER